MFCGCPFVCVCVEAFSNRLAIDFCYIKCTDLQWQWLKYDAVELYEVWEIFRHVIIFCPLTDKAGMM